MKLNRLEKTLVSHPFRFWVQQKVEAPLLMSMFDTRPEQIDSALEIGCGYGEGIAMIQDKFAPRAVTAIDLDSEQVARVQQRYHQDARVEVRVGDATSLEVGQDSFDLVCNFAVFHHIPDWQAAVAEVFRVLKPGGHFLLEDLYRAAICNPVSKRLFVHPQENRFDHGQLLAELEYQGFEIVSQRHLLNLSGMILARKPRFS